MPKRVAAVGNDEWKSYDIEQRISRRTNKQYGRATSQQLMRRRGGYQCTTDSTKKTILMEDAAELADAFDNKNKTPLK